MRPPRICCARPPPCFWSCGEEGLSDNGVSLSKLIQNPLAFLEATGEVYAGTGDVFQSSRRARPTFVGHLRAYRDLSEDKNVDLGVSFAHGQTDVGAAQGLDLHKDLVGFDATFRYRPLRRAPVKRHFSGNETIESRHCRFQRSRRSCADGNDAPAIGFRFV